MLEDLASIINAMSITSDYRGGWKLLEPTIGYGHIVTLTWPKFKLKVVSFKMPDDWNNETAYAEMIRTIDPLYDVDGQIIWRTVKTENTREWDDTDKAFVIDVVDAFLSGEWTPPWKCGFCQQRHNKKITPRW